MIFTPSKSLKTEKHSDTPAPRIIRRPSFGSSPPLKSGSGSSQQLLHVPHFTHALCVCLMAAKIAAKHTHTNIQSLQSVYRKRDRKLINEMIINTHRNPLLLSLD